MKQLALITGASKGIGLELAKVFAENGYDLVINSGSDAIYESKEELTQLGVEVTPIKADLSTREGVDDLYGEVRALNRPLDVLVLNAGVGVGGEFVTNSYEDELYLMNLNIVNMVYLTKLVLKDMVRREEGKILFTSSIAAEMPGPYYAVYAASKAFVQSFAQAIRYELVDRVRNITVTALQPGPTDTDFFQRAHMEDTPVGRDSKDDPREVAKDGFEALMSGKDHVVGGSLKNVIEASAAKLMPETQKAKIHGREAKPDELN